MAATGRRSPSCHNAPHRSLSAPRSAGWGRGPGSPRAPGQTLVQTRQPRPWPDLRHAIREYKGLWGAHQSNDLTGVDKLDCKSE